MEDLMEEMDIEVSDVPSEPDVEELMENIEGAAKTSHSLRN